MVFFFSYFKKIITRGVSDTDRSNNIGVLAREKFQVVTTSDIIGDWKLVTVGGGKKKGSSRRWSPPIVRQVKFNVDEAAKRIGGATGIGRGLEKVQKFYALVWVQVSIKETTNPMRQKYWKQGRHQNLSRLIFMVFLSLKVTRRM